MCRFLNFIVPSINSHDFTLKDAGCFVVLHSFLWHRYRIDKMHFGLLEGKRSTFIEKTKPEFEDLIRTSETVTFYVITGLATNIWYRQGLWLVSQAPTRSGYINIFMYCVNDYAKLNSWGRLETVCMHWLTVLFVFCTFIMLNLLYMCYISYIICVSLQDLRRSTKSKSLVLLIEIHIHTLSDAHGNVKSEWLMSSKKVHLKVQ